MAKAPYREQLQGMAHALRQEGLSQAQIGQKLGVPRGTVARWLWGVNNGISEDVKKEALFVQNGRYSIAHNGALVPRLLEGRYQEVAQAVGMTKQGVGKAESRSNIKTDNAYIPDLRVKLEAHLRCP